MRHEHDDKGGIYHTDCAACVARLLAGMPAVVARQWWMRIKKSNGDEFMNDVRKLIKGK